MNNIFKPKSKEQIHNEFFRVVKPSNYYKTIKAFELHGAIIDEEDDRNLLIAKIRTHIKSLGETTTRLKEIGTWYGNTQIAFDGQLSKRKITVLAKDEFNGGVAIRISPYKKMRKIPKYEGHLYRIDNMEIFKLFMDYLRR